MADNIDDLLTKEEQAIFQSPWALSMLKLLCAEHNAKADQFHKIHIETFDDVIKVIQENREQTHRMLMHELMACPSEARIGIAFEKLRDVLEMSDGKTAEQLARPVVIPAQLQPMVEQRIEEPNPYWERLKDKFAEYNGSVTDPALKIELSKGHDVSKELSLYGSFVHASEAMGREIDDVQNTSVTHQRSVNFMRILTEFMDEMELEDLDGSEIVMDFMQDQRLG